MAFNNGDTIPSYYKGKNAVHKLSTGEASSGEVILTSFFGSNKTAAAIAAVYSSAGAPRTLTKVTVISGTVDITGSGFTAGDLAVVKGFTYTVV